MSDEINVCAVGRVLTREGDPAFAGPCPEAPVRPIVLTDIGRILYVCQTHDDLLVASGVFAEDPPGEADL